ncbi:MAG: hypothetical protein IT458_18425 [Planctomycetes bacterium]|nr:hypothetical protein [Planctomycetota bacterium]
MTKVGRSVLFLPLLLCLAAGSIPQSKGDTLTVTRKETKLRSAKRLFAPPVADLREGDRLVLQAKEGAWLSVKHKETAGWLHATDVSANKEVRLSGEGVRESYSASEAAAARKGFNPQVEREYRKDNPDLENAFRLVDGLERRRASEAEVQAFLKQGGLWKEDAR